MPRISKITIGHAIFDVYHIQRPKCIASLPGCSFLQILITCSMPNGGGRPGESHAQHQVDKLCIDQPQIYQITSYIDAIFLTLQSQLFGQDIRRRTPRFFVRHRPSQWPTKAYRIFWSLSGFDWGYHSQDILRERGFHRKDTTSEHFSEKFEGT